jgi:RNA polymerase sigma-70 factor (ECF subfamily)
MRVRLYIKRAGWRIDAADADDLTHQVFYKLCRDLRCKPWLLFADDIVNLILASTRTIILNEARRRSREGRAMEEFARQPVRQPPQPYDELHDKETDGLIRDSVAELPQQCRKPAELVIAGERTMEEAAEITGLPLGTVKTRVTRARELMFRAITARKELRYVQELGSERNAVPAERASPAGAGDGVVRPRGKRKAAS